MRPLNTLLASAVLLSSAAFADTAEARPSVPEILTELSGDGEFDNNPFDYDMLLKAVVAASDGDVNVLGALSSGKFTLFAPNDLGFIRLAQDLGYTGSDEAGAFGAIVSFLTTAGEGDPIPLLTDVLLYHVSPERISASRFIRKAIRNKSVETLLTGAEIQPYRLFFLKDAADGLQDPSLFFPINLFAKDRAVIHTINRVLIPLTNDQLGL